MYQVYVDDLLIYDDRVITDNRILVSPSLSLEANSAGSLEFTIPPSNIGYDRIKLFTSTTKVFRFGKEIWCGRPLSMEESIYKQRTYYCEGALAYLNDSVQLQLVYGNKNLTEFMREVLAVHNDKVPDNRKIYFKEDTASDLQRHTYWTDYMSTMDLVNGVIERYSCYVKIERNTESGNLELSFVGTPSHISSQDIRFGVNLLDATVKWDFTNMATAILPLGEVIQEAETIRKGEAIHVDFLDGAKWIKVNEGNHSAEILDILTTGNPNNIREKYRVSKRIDVSSLSGQQLYITCQNNYTHCLYLFTNSETGGETEPGYVMENGYQIASEGSDQTQLVDEIIKVPDQAQYLRIGTYTQGLDTQLNKAEVIPGAVDTYLTVDRASRGSRYISAEPINKFNVRLEQGDIYDREESEASEEGEITWGYNKDGVTTRIRSAGYIKIYNGQTYVIHVESPKKPLQIKLFFYAQDYNQYSDPIGTYADAKDEYKWANLDDNGNYVFTYNDTRALRIVLTDYGAGEPFTPEDITLIQMNDGTTPSVYTDPSISPRNTYGFVAKVVQWNDISDSVALLTQARSYLSSTQFDSMEITVKAVDLGVFGEGNGTIDILDNILVYSQFHGLNRYFTVMSMKIPLQEPSNTEITVSNAYNNYSTISAQVRY